MRTEDVRDALSTELASLTPLAPDQLRADRLRVRCRAQLERRANRTVRNEPVFGLSERVFVPALLGALSAVYAAALFTSALRIEGLLR